MVHEKLARCSTDCAYLDGPGLRVSLGLGPAGHLVLEGGELLQLLHGVLQPLRLGQLLGGGALLTILANSWFISRTA